MARHSRPASSKGEVDGGEHNVEEMVIIERPIYSQKEFDKGFEEGKRPLRNVSTWAKSKAKKCECTYQCVRRFISLHLPFLGIMREYNVRANLMHDIAAGLTIGIMHIPQGVERLWGNPFAVKLELSTITIPQGMAYGQLTTLPPVYGLYVSFFPVILYYFFGTSKHISTGSFAILSLMVASTIEKGLQSRGLEFKTWNTTVNTGTNVTLSLVDNSKEILDIRFKIAMSLTLVVGLIQFFLGVFQLGFLTVYMSDPLISGFTTGTAIHVLTSQIKHIFGISMGQYGGAFNIIYSYNDMFMNLPNTNIVTVAVSIVCLLLLIFVKEFINNNPKMLEKLTMPIPAELIAVVLGTVVSYFAQLEEKFDLKVVGNVPVGLPAPNLANLSFLAEVVKDAFVIAVVGFAISVSMAKIFASKHDYEVDSNQELLAYGIGNIVSSFFSCFVSGVSLSRSLVQENVGGKTQITGLVSSALIIIVLLVVGPYFKTLPNCVLACTIIVALKGMFMQFGDLRVLWSISVFDFTVWIVAFAATMLLDVDLGLFVGVVFSLLTVIIRSQRPYSCLLGQVPGTDIYKDINVYKTAEETPYIKIFRFDSALFFANTEFFKSSLYKMTVDPNELKEKQRKLDKMEKKKDEEFMNMALERLRPRLDRGSEGCVTGVPISWKRSHLAHTASRHTMKDIITESPSETSNDSNLITQLPTLTDVHFIIVDCSTMSYMDSMGVKVLLQIILELRAYNVTVYLAQCKASVREMFESTNFYETGSKRCHFITIHDAVISARLQQWTLIGAHNGEDV